MDAEVDYRQKMIPRSIRRRAMWVGGAAIVVPFVWRSVSNFVLPVVPVKPFPNPMLVLHFSVMIGICWIAFGFCAWNVIQARGMKIGWLVRTLIWCGAIINMLGALLLSIGLMIFYL